MRAPLTLAILAATVHLRPWRWRSTAASTRPNGRARATSPISARCSRCRANRRTLPTAGLGPGHAGRPGGRVPQHAARRSTRTRQKVQRDFEAQVDRVNLMVDFDGDGRTGYNFTVSSTDGIADAVITNENQFNDDWDGNWQHAVSEDDDRLVGGDADPVVHRADARGPATACARSSIYLDRVIGSTGERSAWPARELRAAALPVRLRAGGDAAVQPVAAGDHAVRVGPVRQRRAATATSTAAPTSSGSRTASSS